MRPSTRTNCQKALTTSTAGAAEQNNAHQQGTEKMVTNRAQKTGHQASKAQVPQQKLAVQYFLQQILDHASKIKV